MGIPPLRILHTESSTGLGGQEFRVLAEAEGMARRGHAVTLAVPPDSRLREYAGRMGLRVEPLALRKGRMPVLVAEFLALIRKHGIQVVNTHGSVDSWTASIAGRLSDCMPIIIRTRHKSTPIARNFRHRLLYQRLPHAIITTGMAVREDLIRTHGIAASRVVSIPTGVDLTRFSPITSDGSLRAEFGFPARSPLVGTIAFLRDYKGLHHFVEVAGLVLRAHPDARFLIVGTGPEEERLRGMIRDLGLSSRVVLAGYREDIPNVLAAVDMLVLTSVEGEGLPQAVTQAMAMRRPVVATAVGSVGEVVKHGETGLLAPPGNLEELARNICLLITDKELSERVAGAGRDLIVRSYTLEDMLDMVEDLYRRLLDRPWPEA